MSYELEYVDDVPIVSLDGNISRSSARWLDDVIISVFKSGQTNMILDFSKVEHIDYKLVEHLSSRIKELKNAGGEISLAAVNHYVRNIFKAMGWQEELYPSVAEALLGLLDEAVARPWQ